MGKFFRGLAWTVGILLVIGLVARMTFMNAWILPDDPSFAASVEPSLAGGDTVLMLTRGTPAFGDLVRCADPNDPAKFVVGRIAGVSGDMVETEGRNFSVNGKRYEAQMKCPKTPLTIAHPVSGADVKLDCDVVEMGGGWHYRGTSEKSTIVSNSKNLVGKDMVFLLSDDRSYHDDSRDYGTVPLASCKERIFFRLWGKGGWNDDKSRLSFVR